MTQPKFYFFILATLLAGEFFSSPPETIAQTVASSTPPELPVFTSASSWKSFSDTHFRGFINDIFITAQQVRPELRAAGLRQLAAAMVDLDAARALWVYEQAFTAAQLIPVVDRIRIGERLEKEIILEEAKLDFAKAVEHALALQSEIESEGSETPPENEKLVLLADLIRRIPPDDNHGLFQKIVPALVREDEHFDQVLALTHDYQKNFPDRTQQFFSEALLQFQIRPADEILLRSFSTLTLSVATTNPALAEAAIDLLLKKADELDSKVDAEKSMTPGFESSTTGLLGRFHMLVLGQLFPVIQKINPTRASEWALALRDRRNLQNLNHAAAQLDFRARAQTDTPSRGKTNPLSRSLKTLQSPVPGDPSSGKNLRVSSERLVTSQDQQPFQQILTLSKQPVSAFSLTLNTDLVQAQALSNNNPEEFSHRLNEILPRVEAEPDARAKASALVQVALAFFQMGDRTRAWKFTRESLARSQEGDASMFRMSNSPSVFFAMYCATSNVVAKLAPLFPREAIEAMRTISDAQLRLRVMIDSLRTLDVLSSNATPRSFPKN